jgi:hypothetical protein
VCELHQHHDPLLSGRGLSKPLPTRTSLQGTVCWIDLQSFYLDRPADFDGLAAPISLADLYGQRLAYKALTTGELKLVRGPQIIVDRTPGRSRWDGDVHEAYVHIPVLDAHYGEGNWKARKFICSMDNWCLRQSVLGWGAEPPAGVKVIDKAMTDRIFAHERRQEQVGE